MAKSHYDKSVEASIDRFPFVATVAVDTLGTREYRLYLTHLKYVNIVLLPEQNPDVIPELTAMISHYRELKKRDK